MLPANLKNRMTEKFDYRVRFHEPMAAHTSFRVGGPADALVMPRDVEELIDLMQQLVRHEIPWFVLGGGTNLLVTDKGIRGVVISMREGFRKIVQEDAANDAVTVYAEAGARLSELCRFAVERGLAGMNFAVGIPGTVGGALVMNAGTADGDMSGIVAELDLLSVPDRRVTVMRSALSFSYRKLNFSSLSGAAGAAPVVILAVRLRLTRAAPAQLAAEAEARLSARWEKQPKGFSAGCMFKNPAPDMPAGELIDRAGLKGARIGRAQVSEKHANFIVNTKDASAADVIRLVKMVQEKVFTAFQVHLEPEVRIVGEE